MSGHYLALDEEPIILRTATGYVVDLISATLVINSRTRPVVTRHEAEHMLPGGLLGNGEAVDAMRSSAAEQALHRWCPMPPGMPPSSTASRSDLFAKEYRWVWWTVAWEER